MTITGGQEFMVSKVLCAIFGNLHSLPYLPLSPLWCNFKNKIGTEPLTSEIVQTVEQANQSQQNVDLGLNIHPV